MEVIILKSEKMMLPTQQELIEMYSPSLKDQPFVSPEQILISGQMKRMKLILLRRIDRIGNEESYNYAIEDDILREYVIKLEQASIDKMRQITKKNDVIAYEMAERKRLEGIISSYNRLPWFKKIFKRKI